MALYYNCRFSFVRVYRFYHLTTEVDLYSLKCREFCERYLGDETKSAIETILLIRNHLFKQSTLHYPYLLFVLLFSKQRA